MKNRMSVPLMVSLAVVALVLGSFGTATAAGITKSQVKKIATKVVKKQAASLSVANAANAATAATAANATNLGGKPASAYIDNATLFRLAPKAAATSQTWSFALPAGSYDVQYNVVSHASAAHQTTCYLQDSATATQREGLAYAVAQPSGGFYATANGQGPVTVSNGVAAVLTCLSPTAFTVDFDASKSSVLFVPLDTLTTSTGPGPTAHGDASIAGH